MKTLTISLVLVVGLLAPQFFASATINTLNGLSNATQFLVATGTDANLSIKITSSSPSTNFFRPIWSGVLSISRGGTGTSTTPTSNGQLLMASGNSWMIGNLIQGSNIVLTTSTIGQITIGITSTPTFTSLSLTNPLAPSSGGTGANISSFSQGDILVAQSSTTLVRLLKGLDGQVLMVSSTSPNGIAWVTLPTTPTSSGIAFDSAETSSGSNTDTITFNHTVTGSNTILIIGVLGYGTTADVISSVTFDGVTATRVGSISNSGSYNTPQRLYSYIIPDATIGTHSVVINSSQSLNVIAGLAASYTGAQQTGQPDAHNETETDNTTSLATPVTTVADKSWVVDFVRNNGGNLTAGADTSTRFDGGNFSLFEYSNNPKTPAGSLTLYSSGNISTDILSTAVSISPSQ